MANQDISRSGGRHKKRDVCVFFAEVEYDEILTSGDVYQLAKLPPESIVLSAISYIVVQNNQGTAATFDLGFDGGAELLNDADLKLGADASEISTLIPIHLPTGATLTMTPTLSGAAATAGRVFLLVEYLEYRQCTGELTNFVT